MNISNRIMISLLFSATLSNQLPAMAPQKNFSNAEEKSFLSDTSMLKDLISKNELSPNAEDQAGRTLLIAAIEADDLDEAARLDIVTFLVTNGADVDLGIDCAEQPPLHCSIWNFHSDILEFLLENGTQHIKHPDADGTIPLCTAAHGGKLINAIDDGTITQKDLDLYIPVCQKMIRILVSKGACINEKNETGETALHEAVTWELPQLVQTLIDLGADKTVTDKEGKTPLDYALTRENQEIIAILT